MALMFWIKFFQSNEEEFHSKKTKTMSTSSKFDGHDSKYDPYTIAERTDEYFFHVFKFYQIFQFIFLVSDAFLLTDYKRN